ncbi:MAG: alpha-L-fucosidase [Isosphaeraceae bacterium]
MRYRVAHIILTACALSALPATALGGGEAEGVAGPYRPAWESLKAHQDPEWFRDAKFGIYTHWGPVTVGCEDCPSGGQWYGHEMYDRESSVFAYHKNRFGDQTRVGYKDIIPLFRAQKFNAEAWADLFARSGARFAGPVAVHHDNFAMWDSAVTPWNAVKMGPHRDVVGELAKAIKGHGLKFLTTFHHGFAWRYFEPAFAFDGALPRFAQLYTQAHKPGAPPSRRFLETWLAMVNEVVSKYQPDMIWFDFELRAVITPEYQQRMFADYYNWAAANHRESAVAHKFAEIQQYTGILDFERGREDRLVPYPWLTDTALADWFNNKATPYRSLDSIIQILVDIVSKNGCMLLDVSPTAEGAIPDQARQILLGMGDWLKTSGEAVYATRPWVVHGEGPTKGKRGGFSEQHDRSFTARDIRFTRNKSNTVLYATVLGWPGDGATLSIATLNSRAFDARAIASISLLGVKDQLIWTQDARALKVVMPAKPPGAAAYALRLTFKTPAIPPLASAAAAIQIKSDRYSVSVDATAGRFTLALQPSGKTILTDGRLSGQGGAARVVDRTDRAFGKGKAIEIDDPDGNREQVALYPGAAFVFFRRTLTNRSAKPIVLNHVPAVSAVVDLGKPLAEIRTLGTGGLLEPVRNPGSYAFLAVVNPGSRQGVVGGWITHDRGSGVVFSPVDHDVVRIKAQLDYGRLRIKPGQSADTETFALGYFDDARLGLEAYADAVARHYAISLPPQHAGSCTWYMEKFGGSSDEKHLLKLAEYAASNLQPFGFGFIQIDDGWQAGTTGNGPRKDFTTHRSSGPYPAGMKRTAEKIKQLGLTPGIWFMPFAGNAADPHFKDLQKLFVRNSQGKPYDTDWGGTCLDMTNPDTRQYVRSIVERIAHQWEYKLFKMDGFWTGCAARQMYVNNGYVNDGLGDAVFANPDKTNIEALRDGVRLVREAAGPGVFLLGCCVAQNMRSFGGSFGLLDAMRVGPDTGAGAIGAPHASRLWFLNGRVWWNDPDCVSVRASMPVEQARLNASFTAIAGDLFYNSDWMPDLPAERLDILRRSIPPHGLNARPVDVFENEPARIWHLADTRGTQRRDVVALYNWSKQPVTISWPTGRIGLPAARRYVGFDFWANRFLPPFQDELRAELPGGSCRILAIRPLRDHPQLLSTSRHVTQGMIDVTEENWDAASLTLSARSKVVASDPYELRIVLPAGERILHAKEVIISAADRLAGVKTSCRQNGTRLRVTLKSPVSREVRWRVRVGRTASRSDTSSR